MTAKAKAAIEPTETAAQKYARIKEEQFDKFLEDSFSAKALRGVQLEDVTVPSGMTFRCRRLDAAYLAQIGQMPVSLASAVLKRGTDDLEDPQSLAQTFMQMSNREKLVALANTAKAVRYIAVEPRLVLGEVNGHKDAVSVDALTTGDFTTLAAWARSGGESAERLKTFRRKRR